MKGKKKRWGKKSVDKRDWAEYNEELVVRGEFYLDLGWVESWDRELAEMNDGKVGRPYGFPESLIKLQAVWHQWVDLRGVEGITRKIAEAGKLPMFNDYTTIGRRINKLDISFTLPKRDSVEVSCDGSGMDFGNAGQYKERMYGASRKKYLKVKIAADPRTKKLLDCEVSVEGEGDSEPEAAKNQMTELQTQGIAITKFWGDGGYDSIDLFEFLELHDIKSAIKIRENAVFKNDMSLRDKELLDYRKKGYRKWAKKKEYGIRWVGTEGIFSAVKRKFGEQTRSKKIENALNEVKRKFWVYDEMKSYAENLA